MTVTTKKKSVTISPKPTATETVTTTEVNAPAVTAAPDQEKAKNLLGKAVYHTVYFASYGIVFGTLLITSFIPVQGRNLLGKAIDDGSAAARKAFDNAGSETTASA